MVGMNGKVAMNGKLVALRRTELGLTQAAFATRVGCCHRTVQRAEKGSEVLLKTAKEIAQALGVELPTVMTLVPVSNDKRRRDREEWSTAPRWIDDNANEDRVVAAFNAAHHAIQHTLGADGEYGLNEVTEVLSLLATYYGCESLKVVRVGFEQGMMTILHAALAEEGIGRRSGEVRS